MGTQARLLLKLSLLIGGVALLPLAGGCGSKHLVNKCTPRSPWQSPTIHSMRSLLLINADELRVVLVDGCEVEPTFVADSGVREYHLMPGPHTITAVFRYEVSLLADVKGLPLTLTHDFLPGHAYVAVYREHVGRVPEYEVGVAEADSTVIDSPPLFWSLDILDLADEQNIEPEVEQARGYNAWIMGVTASAASAESGLVY